MRYETAPAELEMSRIERPLMKPEPAGRARAANQDLGDFAGGHPAP
jgi:hypothetical protein